MAEVENWAFLQLALASGLGIYIKGENYEGIVVDLNYVQTANCDGWGQLPVWAGPQDFRTVSESYGSGCSKFTQDLTGTFAVGRAEAAKAVSVMASLGRVTDIVYYDLENYTPYYTAADNNLV